jgi:16S rRNA (cytosine1402-N4)-methyltransferase
MTTDSAPDPNSDPTADTPRPPRRKRYAGKNPKRWEDKYKELRGDEETVAKVVARGKTAAGTHRPIMVDEILQCLRISPGQIGVDATLGYGGHAEALLTRLGGRGQLIGLDQDPLQLPVTVARLRQAGYGEELFVPHRTNFAGALKVLLGMGLNGVNFLIADLGVSSMQIDNPERGFSFKHPGPLDMRMNPQRGITASQLLEKSTPVRLAAILEENADEPAAELLAEKLAGQHIGTTTGLTQAIAKHIAPDVLDDTLRRVFQALRIAVNEEFTALESLLRLLPQVLLPGGRAAILTFHSGEDRRVKKAFAAGIADGIYAETNREVIRATAAEIHDNPRASSAKLRWVRRSGED